MPKILIATNNSGKVREIRDLLTPETGLQQVELVTPRQLGLDLKVLENGQTYADNAALKARAFFRAAAGRQADPLVILADDSGLEVDALGGAPGLHSARYSPQPGATDADRRAYLLQNLTGLPRPWNAHFHCTVALISPGGELAFTVGDCPGEIIPAERGTNGFGYDPIFWLPSLGRTMAELSMEQKNRLSHRALAVTAALPLIRGWLGR